MDKESLILQCRPESFIQSHSKDWPIQKVLDPSIFPHPHASQPRLSYGLCRRAGADPEGAAAGGQQLPALLATEQHVVFLRKQEVQTSVGATALEHVCSKITGGENSDTISWLLKKKFS